MSLVSEQGAYQKLLFGVVNTVGADQPLAVGLCDLELKPATACCNFNLRG